MIPQEVKDLMYIPDGFYDPFGDPSYEAEYFPEFDMYSPIFVPVDNSKLTPGQSYATEMVSTENPPYFYVKDKQYDLMFSWDRGIAPIEYDYQSYTGVADNWNTEYMIWGSAFTLDGSISSSIYPPETTHNKYIEIEIVLLSKATGKPLTNGEAYGTDSYPYPAWLNEVVALKGILEDPWDSAVTYAPILHADYHAKPTISDQGFTGNKEFPIFSIVRMYIPREEALIG